MCIHFEFDYKKATQALNFISNAFDRKVNKLKAIKLLFFADRYHLRKYGRPISQDEYVAMKLGPVASNTKDIAENSSFLDDIELTYSREYIKQDGYDILSINNPDLDIFSESDIEALNFAIENFGQFDQYVLANITHAYPEWKKHEKDLRRLRVARMEYEDFFEDPAVNDPHLAPLDSKDLFEMSDAEKEAVLEFIEEQKNLKKLWERNAD